MLTSISVGVVAARWHPERVYPTVSLLVNIPIHSDIATRMEYLSPGARHRLSGGRVEFYVDGSVTSQSFLYVLELGQDCPYRKSPGAANSSERDKNL